MPMSRAQLAADVAASLSEYIAETEIQPADTVGNLKEPIDKALRALGRTSSTLADPIEDSQEVAAIALAEWRVLERLHNALTTVWTNSDFDGPESRLQLVESLKRLEARIAAAKADADLELSTITDTTWSFGSLNLNYLSVEECA